LNKDIDFASDARTEEVINATLVPLQPQKPARGRSRRYPKKQVLSLILRTDPIHKVATAQKPDGRIMKTN